MKLSARLAAQLAHPRGLSGRLLGRAMDVANRRPLRLALDSLTPRTGENILDFGCGTGAALEAMAEEADCGLYGIDRSETMIATARARLAKRATLFHGDIADLPPEWPRFDALVALNVLYFADGAMVDSLRRALRHGGRLIAYVSDRVSMERWAFTRAGHHRLYAADELEELLVEGGFARASIRIKEHPVAPRLKGLIAHAER